MIEDFLDGEEASFIVMVDGRHALALATSQDHKRLKDGDVGPNTGGMGAYSPAPVVTPSVHAKVMREVIKPAIAGMEADGVPFVGFLYAGLMIGKDGQVNVVEFNCRLGDPETQPIILRLKSDLLTLLDHALAGTLDKAEAEWDTRAALGVVLAAHGYPDAPRQGDAITGLPAAGDDYHVFHSGTALNGKVVVAHGGRVLCVTALGHNVKTAQRRAHMKSPRPSASTALQMRRDIGAPRHAKPTALTRGPSRDGASNDFPVRCRFTISCAAGAPTEEINHGKTRAWAKSLTVPASMKAWVLGNPDELKLVDKPVPQPGAAEVLVRIDAIAVCATDLEIIHSGPPALIQGGDPFNKNFTPGHEYMGTVVKLGPGVDEFDIGDRVHGGNPRGVRTLRARCREGMYTACTNYGMNYGDRNKGHRANGFTTDGGFAQFAVNNINTMVHVPDDMSDEEATLVVTAGTAMYGLDVMGGLIAGQTVVVMGPGPIGLMGVGVAKALGAQPVILTGTRDNRLEIGKKLGADHVVNVRKEDAVEAV